MPSDRPKHDAGSLGGELPTIDAYLTHVEAAPDVRTSTSKESYASNLDSAVSTKLVLRDEESIGGLEATL